VFDFVLHTLGMKNVTAIEFQTGLGAKLLDPTDGAKVF